MKNSVQDPALGYRTAYLRWFVLNHLLELPTNARGSGSPLTSDALHKLWCESDAPSPFDASRREMGQTGRHFSLENAGEHCLYWRNGNPAAFGVTRGGRQDAERLRARYEGRIAAFSLERLPDDFEEPAPPKFVTDANISRDPPNPVLYDSRRVDAFVKGIGPGPVTYTLLSYLAGIGVAASRDQLTERLEEYESMSNWERANVLFRLAELAAESVRVRAQTLASRAREETP